MGRKYGIYKKCLEYFWILILVTIELLQMELSCGMAKQLISMELKYVFVNWIVIALFNSILLLAIGKAWITALVSGGLITFISVVNYYVILYHGMPLSVSELRNFKTALYVAGTYSYPVSRSVLYILACFLMTAGMSVLLKKGQIAVKRKVSAAMLAVCFVAVCFGFFGPRPIKPKVTLGWSWKEACKQCGYISYLVEDVYTKAKGVTKPDHYDPETVREKCSTYQADRINQNNELPDIILILNESFYDLHQITGFQTDQDYLANIQQIEDMVCGYAVSPCIGGGTNASEYELLTSNSLYLVREGAPFNILDLEDAGSLVTYLKSLGYSTFGTHSEPAGNYNRIYGYPALGFEDVRFHEDYEDCWSSEGRMYKSDYSVYENVKKWYMQMGDQPRFMYCLTIQNHGGWEQSPEESDTVHVTEGEFARPDIVNEYLTSIAYSDEAFSDFIQYIKTITDRKVVVCMLGDHAPDFAVSLADEEYSEGERNLLIGGMPLYIWANFGLEKADLGYMSMHYVAPVLLDAAGVPLSPYYKYLMDTKREVPVIAAWGKYYDKDYEYYDIGTGSCSQIVEDYFSVEYNNIKGGDERVTDFFESGLVN